MGAYKYIRESFAKTTAQRGETVRKRLEAWRKQPGVVRVDNPTNPARAREVGYKAKKEFIIARVRVSKGKRSRPRAEMGRKPGKNVKRVPFAKPLSWLAEQKAAKKFTNLAVINSYNVASDGDVEYYEIVLRA